MREYETIFVLEPELEQGSVEEQITRVCKIIEERGGEVHDIQRWGRRRLAYPIKKKSDGIYTFVRFGGDNRVLTELEHRYKLNESMLRHLTVMCETPPAVEPETAEADKAADADADAAPAPAEDTAPAAESAEAPATDAPVETAAAETAEAPDTAEVTAGADGDGGNEATEDTKTE